MRSAWMIAWFEVSMDVAWFLHSSGEESMKEETLAFVLMFSSSSYYCMGYLFLYVEHYLGALPLKSVTPPSWLASLG